LLRYLLNKKMSISGFKYEGARTDIATGSGELADLFWQNTGTIVHKWHHYIPIYERYFGPFRGNPVRMLEIGVSKGGSLDMWRKYLGPDAIIFGIDIDPNCARYDGMCAQVRIGSQADPKFLASVIAEMGGVDIVLDDGSHRNPHINASLDVLFPLLSDGGIYLVEDTHACYWPNFSGGYRLRSSFMERTKAMLDDLHHWYHGRGATDVATRGNLAALHVYDSVVVLEKRAERTPQHSVFGVAE
jgi:hypothetical protein